MEVLVETISPLNLMDYITKRIFHHPSFDIQYINVPKNLSILISITERFNNNDDDIEFIGSDNDEYNEIFKNTDDTIFSIIKSFLNGLYENNDHRLDKNGSVSTINHNSLKEIIGCILKFENEYLFQHTIDEILQYTSPENSYRNINNILLALCRSNNKLYMDYVFHLILNSEIFDVNDFKSKTIQDISSLEKVIISANRHQNIYLIEWIFKNLFDDKIFKKLNIEKILLSASNINNVEVMLYIIEKIFNIKYLKVETSLKKRKSLKSISIIDMHSIDLTFVHSIDSHFLILILNVLIKLETNVELIKYLLIESGALAIENKKININVPDCNHEYPLLIASLMVKNNIENIKIFNYFLYELEVNIYIKDINGLPMFISALKTKNYLVLHSLFKRNIQLINLFAEYPYNNNNNKNNNNKNNNNKNNINKNNINRNYYLSLMKKAIIENNIDFIKEQLKSGNDNNYNNSYVNNNEELKNDNEDNSWIYYFSPLILSYLLHRDAIRELLIDHEDINEMDEFGYTILHYAILKNDTQMVNYLISRDDNMVNNKGHSIFNVAIKIQNKEIMSILLQNNVLLRNEMNHEGENLLIALIKMTDLYNEEENLSFLKEFIEKGVSVDQRDKKGKSSLFYAIDKNLLLTIDLLIDHSMDYNDDSNNHHYNDNELKVEEDEEYKDLTLVNYIIRYGSETVIKFIAERHPQIFTMNAMNTIIKMNRLDLLKLMITDSNISRRDDQGKTIFNYALMAQNEEIVRYLDKGKIELSEYDITEDLIINLIKKNQIEILKILLPKYVDINMKLKVNYNTYSILSFSVKNGNFPLCKYLIDHNVKINEEEEERNFESSVITAIKNNQEKILKLLIDHGANVNDGKPNYFPLSMALNGHYRNLNIIKLLVEHGADFDGTNFHEWCRGQYSLYKLISINKWEEGFKYFIEKGVNINCDNDSQALILFVIRHNMESFLKILIDHGVDLNREYLRGGVPLIFAIKNNRTKMAKYLIDSGANINCKDRKGQTPITMAILKKNKFIIKYLLEKGVDVDENLLSSPELSTLLENDTIELEEDDVISCDEDENDDNQFDNYGFYNNDNESDYEEEDEGVDKEGIINLCTLIENGNNDEAKEMIENGQIKNINQINNITGDTLLITAVKIRNIEMVKYLIGRGANIDKEGKYSSSKTSSGIIYKSPLMFAITNNDLPTVKVLIENGAQVNKKSDNGRMIDISEIDEIPLNLAIDNNNMAIVKYLVEEGADINQKNYSLY